MCGIAGFVGQGGRETLSAMIDAIKHRGPDDSGVWLSNNVGLAHARLSILDLSPLGHQPMFSRDGTVAITFNGEIYNFLELKSELEKKGRTFVSKTDTEVIIQLYEEYGEVAFSKLIGMFAFALYDSKNQSLFLVRDRMGEKPLYYTIQDNTLVFASEPKALFKHEAVSKQLNPQGVISYFTYDAVLTPDSIYKNIQKLGPATYARYKNGALTKHSYWTPPQTVNKNISFSDALTELDQLFQKSLAGQLLADVPVGVFLSGGLDSSLVAYYAQKSRQEPIHTFSIGFTDKSYDEAPYAREVAKVLGTQHHEHIVSAKEIRDTLASITQKLDEPISDPAILPNHLLSKFAHEQVKVALGGDGGDELFAGYQTFVGEYLLSWYRLLPRFAREELLRPLVENLPVSHRYFSFDFKAKQFMRGADTPPNYLHQAWLESFSPSEKEALLAPQYKDLLSKDHYARIDEYLREMPQGGEHLRAQYFYLRTYMQDVILAKVDRASMYTSLEVRAPFLDKAIVEFALKLPWEFKQKGMTSKYILRKLMQDKLPSRIVGRKKHGFGLPVGSWFKNEWREFLTDTLSPQSIEHAGVCDPKVVEQLIKEHLEGAANHRKKLWALLVFHLWYRTWM